MTIVHNNNFANEIVDHGEEEGEIVDEGEEPNDISLKTAPAPFSKSQVTSNHESTINGHERPDIERLDAVDVNAVPHEGIGHGDVYGSSLAAPTEGPSGSPIDDVKKKRKKRHHREHKHKKHRREKKTGLEEQEPSEASHQSLVPPHEFPPPGMTGYFDYDGPPVQSNVDYEPWTTSEYFSSMAPPPTSPEMAGPPGISPEFDDPFRYDPSGGGAAISPPSHPARYSPSKDLYGYESPDDEDKDMRTSASAEQRPRSREDGFYDELDSDSDVEYDRNNANPYSLSLLVGGGADPNVAAGFVDGEGRPNHLSSQYEVGGSDW